MSLNRYAAAMKLRASLDEMRAVDADAHRNEVEVLLEHFADMRGLAAYPADDRGFVLVPRAQPNALIDCVCWAILFGPWN